MNLISLKWSPHPCYHAAVSIKIDTLLMVISEFQLISSKFNSFNPSWTLIHNWVLSSSNLTAHGCYYAASSHRIDTPSVLMCNLIIDEWKVYYLEGVGFLIPWLDLLGWPSCLLLGVINPGVPLTRACQYYSNGNGYKSTKIMIPIAPRVAVVGCRFNKGKHRSTWQDAAEILDKRMGLGHRQRSLDRL